MAYAALVSLAQLVEQIIHHDPFFHIPSSDEAQKLESLQQKVSFLQGFLDNYSHKAGETVRSLEAQIRDVAYQAQDIIECHISDEISCRRVKRGFRKLVSALRKIMPRANQNKHEKYLLKALQQMDSIVNEVMNIQISCRVEEMQISHTSALASPSRATNGDNKMVGFDKDLIEIKARLCGESSKLQIIPIVGMGGIGKTTLARNIFDDPLVAYYFDIRAWITISQEYRMHEILLSLLDYLPVTTKNLSKPKEQLMEDVYKSLKGRNYLIIMDDMWSSKAWDDLRRIFPDDNNRSRVVITTRLTDVAEYASSTPIHQMHFLNEDQSWKLLREKVFVEQSCPPELEKIGRMIAKNCGGLPLALAVVAGILRKVDGTQNHWWNIAENISLAMATTDDHLSKILTLSYDHLPNHLKACFLYMGGFPEDYEIPVSKLIMLWDAEGFLKPIGPKRIEEVAEEYLEDLIKRNLVLITKKTSNGRFRFCGIHDVLRDLCIRKAREEKFLHGYTIDVANHRSPAIRSNILSGDASGIDVANQRSLTIRSNILSWDTSGIDIANQRRLTIRSNIYVEDLVTDTRALPIRCVLHFGSRGDLYSFVLCLSLLRVLDASETKLKSFPVEITELFHLRYLAFTYHNSRQKPIMLPPEISKLHNLQTLIIHSSSDQYLPLQIWRIPQIRHVILKGIKLWIHLAKRNGEHFPVLENLHTLSVVTNLKFTSRALHMIPNLKKLKIRYTDVFGARGSKLRLNNLFHLRQLETLYVDLSEAGRILDHPVPASFAFPPNLKKLTLRGFIPRSEDLSIIGSLPNLEVLELKTFEFEEGHWETNEGEFPRLKFLLIQGSNLVCWRSDRTHFPCLQHLIIGHCQRLEEIPGEIGDISTLELIEVSQDSKSAADSALFIREEQRSFGNDILQVRIYKH